MRILPIRKRTKSVDSRVPRIENKILTQNVHRVDNWLTRFFPQPTIKLYKYTICVSYSLRL